MQSLLEQYQQEHDIPPIEIAAALAKMTAGDGLLVKPEREKRSRSESRQSGERGEPRQRRERSERGESRQRKERNDPRQRREQSESRPRRTQGKPEKGMERYRIEVGREHEVKPGNIVGAIANEAGLDSEHIGHIDIQDSHSLVDLPTGMPRGVFQDLKKTWVCGQRLNISRLNEPEKKKKARGKDKKRAKADKKAED